MRFFYINKRLLKWTGAVLLMLGLTTWYFFVRTPDYHLNQLKVYIENDAYLKLSAQQAHAHEVGHLVRTENDFVPGNVNYKNELISGKLRLKGDWLDHLQDNKWSFRIKLEDPLKDGLKVFSVQDPITRGYLNGYVFHELLKQEGILSNELRFTHLYVNDESWGMYCLEEHLSSRMIASQNKHDGLILKFDDKEFFKVAIDSEASTDGLIKKAEIKVYGDAKKKKEFKDEVNRAKRIMHDYQYQVDSVYKYFDAEAMGKYYALCDLTLGYHAMGWVNIRFYYNFKSRKMEPVGYDPCPIVDVFKPYLGHQARNIHKDPFETTMIICSPLKDKNIEKAYIMALQRYSNEKFVRKFLERQKDKMEYLEGEIQKGSYNYEYDNNFLLDRAKELRGYLKNDL